MTIVYISRHSQPFRKLLGEYNANELEQIRNEKNILSVIGEEKAEELSKKIELQNIDVLYSSHYVRAMSTAKYIAENNNILLNVDERFGERKFGINSMNELPKTFFENQFKDWNYKIGEGESLNEVSKRMNDALIDILSSNKNKIICIVSHATAITSMLFRWCNVVFNNNTKLAEIFFKGKLVFDGNWESPELFKLEFDDNNNLHNIENIR